ncbi:AraC family transcriptional regulator [Cucumibacter marinus]|uniref:AraC family transcriptional regulator n=1 Tax=Cucumibacter marinus TaxID=1121252 RepID=UPI0003F977CA|nr:AraC family transcriptional regulator [Cucumibacter marinus]
MKRATVAAGLVRSLAAYAARWGLNQSDVLQEVGLTESDLGDQDSRIGFDIYLKLIDVLISQTGEPALLAKHAVETQLEKISVVGLIVGSAASLPDAMAQLNRYATLMVEIDIMEGGPRFSVSQEGGEVWITDNRPDPNTSPALTEAAFGRFIGEFRRNLPEHPFAVRIEMTHAQPAHADQLEQILQCPIAFGCTRNAMQIAPEWLLRPFENTSRYVFGIFADKADALLAELEKEDSIRSRVEAELMPGLHKGEASIDAIASELGMSRATLYRRLKQEGTTFAEIADELRCRMASDYLAARKVSVNEAAYLVGFSEASSFVRAFRRWTGQTPAEYRNQLLAASA